jgi:AcrR family transcriptional regulator
MAVSRAQDVLASERSPLRGAAREHAILGAALALIGEVGYERVTVDSIAGRAHASKTTMYRRWPGKAELVADALRWHAQGDAPAIPDSGSLRGDLLLTVRQIAETLTGRDGPSLIGLLEAIRDDATLRELVGSQIRQRSHEVGRAICGNAAARGETIRSDRSDTVIDIAFARVFTDTLFDAGPPETSAHEHLVDEILLPLLHS